MRCFIAVDLPSEIKSKISALTREIQKKDIIIANFVAQKNLHITLKFLGEIKDVDKIKAKCSEIKGKKFKVILKGVSAFPSQNYVRVLWAGIEKGAEELKELNKKLEILGKDKREFSNHLTIARVKAVKDKDALRKFFTDKEFGEFEVNEFKLVKSTLTPRGPVYKELQTFSFDI